MSNSNATINLKKLDPNHSADIAENTIKIVDQTSNGSSDTNDTKPIQDMAQIKQPVNDTHSSSDVEMQASDPQEDSTIPQTSTPSSSPPQPKKRTQKAFEYKGNKMGRIGGTLDTSNEHTFNQKQGIYGRSKPKIGFY